MWWNMIENYSTHIDDAEGEGRALTATNSEITARVNEYILANRHITIDKNSNERYPKEGNEFLDTNVTRDETWIHLKRDAAPSSANIPLSRLDQYRTVPSPGKVMMTLFFFFFDREGVEHTEFLSKSSTIKAPTYYETLKQSLKN
ncbi:mariner Mos1 transposase [Nephila pilipes]|uniref:Mariner Mos1 transposase n=1 Tax=Nephila pilipes TaxID=299642 RepID=A0A8X6P2F8_NEPPI|nr:mariner Mos1 transposase [Nephila pilipes]